jgi:hypothetical protein
MKNRPLGSLLVTLKKEKRVLYIWLKKRSIFTKRKALNKLTFRSKLKLNVSMTSKMLKNVIYENLIINILKNKSK